jgi:hypothetical protein
LKISTELEPNIYTTNLLTYYQIIQADGLYNYTGLSGVVFIIKGETVIRVHDNDYQVWRTGNPPALLSLNHPQFERLPVGYKFSLTFLQSA